MRIVFQSFGGRWSDNPRALHEALSGREDLELVWLGDPGHLTAFPPDVEVVDVSTPAAREVLESADLLIANTHTELAWEKPPGLTYVQTWHGTPLKRIHRDVLWAPEGRLDRLDGDVARWDLLLSPNAASTPRLRHAFRYEGEVLEAGYPRNDVLTSARAPEVRARVRAALGVPEEATAVLYAPTWRDDEVFAEGSPEVKVALDLEQLGRDLGPQVVVLLRGHDMTTGRMRVLDAPHVRDVSYHPDISDLYLAADAMVTDYSSTMFDFAVTGKPMVFHTPDLERFQDVVRGFYFDLVPVAPGPLVRTTGEVVEALRDLDALAAEHATTYGEFRATFTHLEDGHATERVLDRLGLGPGGASS